MGTREDAEAKVRKDLEEAEKELKDLEAEQDELEDEEEDEDFDPLAMCGGMAEEKVEEKSELSKKWETVGAKEFKEVDVPEDDEEDEDDEEEADDDEEGEDFDPLAMCGGMAEEKVEEKSELSKKW